MKIDFLDFYQEVIYPDIENIEESLNNAKKFEKKIKKIYIKLFFISIGLYFLSLPIKNSIFATVMIVSLAMIILSLCFGIFHTVLNKIIISKIRRSYDYEYYSEILSNILYRFNNNFKKSSKITFPEELYRKLHIEKPYKKYNSSKCIIGNIEGCKTHIAKIKTKSRLSKTQSIVFKVALNNNLKEKTFLISSRHHKKTNRKLPKQNLNLGNNFYKKICIYTKKRNIQESCLYNLSIRQNILELHDILEGNISIYIMNNNVYFKLNTDKNIFNKNFFKLVDIDHFSKYDTALEKMKEIIIGLNYTQI